MKMEVAVSSATFVYVYQRVRLYQPQGSIRSHAVRI